MPWPKCAQADTLLIDSLVPGPLTVLGGDTLVITGSGSISAPSLTAIDASEGNNRITNAGVIRSVGPGGWGIYATNDNTITSSGSISLAGNNSYGFFVSGDNNAIANSGLIGITGSNSLGIYAPLSSNNTITNSGSIDIAGDYSIGIYVPSFGGSEITNSGSIGIEGYGSIGIYVPSFSSGNNTITNSGSIEVVGDDSIGLFAPDGNSVITNSGSIRTAGANSIGIEFYGTSAIVNSGSIAASGDYSRGIYVDGDSSTIANSGSITSSGDYSGGIYVDGDSNTIANSGTISMAFGAGAFGVYAQGSSSKITNSGSISTVGEGAHGLFALGGSNTIVNSGSISTAEYSSYGIFAGGVGSSSITNHGLIRTAGEDANGITAASGLNTLANFGSIATSGEGAMGIFASGGSSVIHNSGDITTSGLQGHGIHVTGDSNLIVNSGRIFVSGTYAGGAFIKGDQNIFINSGSIVSVQDLALAFNGENNTFNTLNNFLAGGVDMGDSGTVNFSTGANYSKLYTFEGVSLSINGSGPVPLFNNLATQQAGTYDPTIIASSSDALGDMTNTIASLIPGRFNGSDSQHPVWVKGFGVKSSYAGTAATLDRNYSFSGVAIGYDAMRTKDLTLGVMGGYGQSGQTADGKTTQSFNSASDDGFLGLYGQKRWKNVAVDVALYGGVQTFQQQRYVNDNLAYLGNSSAKASYQGWWLSPEVGVTYDAGQISGWTILPTARLRYAQQWMGGYTETGGGSANAIVSGRSVAIGQSLIGIGTRKIIKTNLGNDTKMVLDGQIGHVYRGVVGDNTAGVTMIGQSLALPTEASSRSAVALSAGVTLDLSRTVALKVRGDFEAGGGMNYVGGGWAGLSVKF